METKDVLLYESGDGGELDIQNGDIALTETLYQQVYLALFGGNVEENTKTNYLFTEERSDYWGNSLLWENQPALQFNSNTERILNTTALNSSGRLTILRAVQDDLQYLIDVVNFTADVEIESSNRVRITVQFSEKGNQEDKVLQLVYDNAKNEIIIERII